MKNNPVAKYARKYNKAVVHTDRKKETKKGYRKHKERFGSLLISKREVSNEHLLS